MSRRLALSALVVSPLFLAFGGPYSGLEMLRDPTGGWTTVSATCWRGWPASPAPPASAGNTVAPPWDDGRPEATPIHLMHAPRRPITGHAS